MEWLRNHPYADAVAITGSLLIIGALVVRAHTAAPVQRGSTWGGAGSLVASCVAHPLDTSLAPNLSDTQSTSLGPIALNTETSIGGDTSGVDTSSLDALIASVSGRIKNTDTSSSDTSSAYAFVPSGLIATTTLSDTNQTPVQKALYIYGNSVGDIIRAFEDTHPDQPTVLKNHIENRNDPNAIGAMKQLGGDLARVGDGINAIDPAPTQGKAAGEALAAAYRSIGTKLASITDHQDDTSLYDAIVSYNTAAEDFAKKYVSLAMVFQSYSVSFSPSDGGSIFVFPAGGGGL